jgi:hypothetical protein
VLHDLLGVHVAVRLRVLVRRAREIGVDRSRRDEEVVGRFYELDRLAHDTGEIAGDIDRGVPAAAGQRVELAVPVAAQFLDLGIEIGVRLAAVEQRQLVIALERRVDDRAAEELRPAED